MEHWIESHPSGPSQACGNFAAYIGLGPCRNAVVVGDVAGQGDLAGQAANVLKSEVRTLLSCCSSLTEVLYLSLMRFERAVFTEGTPIASLFVAIIDDFEGALRYASAGHESALLFDADCGHRHLEPTGPVLGIPATPVFFERELPLLVGDMLVIVTDGITEARRTEGGLLRFFGTSGVVRAVRSAKSCGQDPARSIYRAAVAHSIDKTIDDATALVVDVSAAGPFLHFKDGDAPHRDTGASM
jgi:sigma-B regulation protein RsbU (phosphoserine phosphatase)